MKKYELVTDESIIVSGRRLYSIRALRDFRSIKKGHAGGWIEKESNLSQEGDCWVSSCARVYGDAQVSDDAYINPYVCVCGNARIFGNARLLDHTRVYGNASIGGNAKISDKVCVFGNAQISGNTHLYGDIFVSHDAYIPSDQHWMAIIGIGSGSDILTAFRQKDNSIRITNGSFNGTLEMFKETMNDEYGNGRYGKIYQLLAPVIELQLVNV